MKKIFVILILSTIAQAEQSFKKDDIVLFPSSATSGRMFRMETLVERVGIVESVTDETLSVQEINYPSRQGSVVYIQTPQGEKRYYGTHDIPLNSEKLIPLTDYAIATDKTIVAHGSRLKITVGRTRILGYVVYVFSDGKNSYAAITDQSGWECYSVYGEDCHTKQYIRLTVRKIL